MATSTPGGTDACPITETPAPGGTDACPVTETPEVNPSPEPPVSISPTQEAAIPASSASFWNKLPLILGCALMILFILLTSFLVRNKKVRSVLLAVGLCAVIAMIAVFLFGCMSVISAPPQDTPEPTPEITASPEVTPTPEPTPTPDPWEAFFMPEGYSPAHNIINDRSYAMYKSQDISISVKKYVVEEPKKQIYYEAHIYMRNGATPTSGFAYKNTSGERRTKPYKIARQYGAILAVNGDFLLTEDVDLKGILIRDGKIYSKGYRNTTTLAFMPDNSLKIYRYGEITADELIEMGVKNTYSFGPVLVEDGEVNPDASKFRVNPRNPRCGVGMVEPGHFVCIVCEGRGIHGCAGYTLDEFAELFKEKGVQLAYNMDGGASSSMCFWGDSLNTHETEYAGQRPVPDIIIFGTSEDVPGVDDPLINDGNGLKKPPRGTMTPKPS